MALKIMQEVTEWSGFARQPNHVYLMDGDKVYAVSQWGKSRPLYMKTFLRIDRRGRKFVEARTNKWRFDLGIAVVESEPVKSSGQTWRVIGSKGNEYEVSLTGGAWTCSCPGHGFRGRCRHVNELRASSPQLV